MVPNARFLELLTDIEPSPTTTAGAAGAHSALRKHLKSHDTFNEKVVRDFLAGSYARDTAIRPKTSEDGVERPDVDIIVVTNYSTGDRPDYVLSELAKAIGKEFKVERINKRSVRVAMTNAEIDVVPVIESLNIYQLPDRELGNWKATNPPGHISWSEERNKDFAGRFKPLVKMMKWWRRENPSGKRPKGFVLEVLVAMHAPNGGTHYGEAFAKLLENIYAAYGTWAENDFKPAITDPSLPGSDILSKVSLTNWKDFIEKVRVYAGYARRAQNEDDMEEATRLWRRVFGDRFKATANPAKAASLANAVIASATGYTFPDKAAAPTKPRGFA
jgi:hypothetical protein